ncbi:iron-containing alcohol dehydrogenase [Kaarinaea lacus]
MLDFSIARLPRIEFSRGAFNKLPDLVAQHAKRVLLVTGGSSFQQSRFWQQLHGELAAKNVNVCHCVIKSEPSPHIVDETVHQYRHENIELVIGIGGGSALDAAKAIAGLLRVNRTVMDYLEGVGPELPYEGPAVPFIAVPTTAGTGSEATKNAVLSVQGLQGFKKSFRHDKLVAEYAVIDPQLLATCPQDIVAANGMDALTQLIESYVSLKSNYFTDALAASGLRAAKDALLQWYEQGQAAEQAQNNMAYAALISGITLAQVGLGSVHGLASPLGAFYPIPHGVVCGTLVATATKMNIDSMLEREANNPALAKYAEVSEFLSGMNYDSQEEAWAALVDLLTDWTSRLALPRLSDFGVTHTGLDHVVEHSRGSSMKTNPIVLTDSEIKQIMEQRL